MQRNSDLAHLERDYGIHLRGVRDFMTPEVKARLAMDAQPAMLTTPNAGIPAWFSTYIDPDVVRIVIAPNKATEVLGEEVKKGDWTTLTAQFPVLEYAGETSAYGDWNNNGSIGANFNFVNRQSFHYQTITQWGERQVEMVGLAKINYKNELDMASAAVLAKFQNKSYFYGIAGLQNYGLLNDPSLPAALTPSTKAAGGTGWAAATANEIFDDVKKMVQQGIVQTKGLVEMTDAMTLGLPPGSEVYLANTNIYGLTARQMIMAAFPKMRIVSAPEYATTGGNLAQLIFNEVDGQRVGYTAFTEKMRTHPIIPDLSAWKQKKSQGTWGAIIRMPLAYVQMLGI